MKFTNKPNWTFRTFSWSAQIPCRKRAQKASGSIQKRKWCHNQRFFTSADASKQQRWRPGVSCTLRCDVCLYCCCCLMQSKLLRGLGTRARLPRLALPRLIIIHKLIVASCDCLKHGRFAFLFFSLDEQGNRSFFFLKQYAALEKRRQEGGPSAFHHVSVATQTDLSSRWDHRKLRVNGPECCERRDSSACQPAGSWPQISYLKPRTLWPCLSGFIMYTSHCFLNKLLLLLNGWKTCALLCM